MCSCYKGCPNVLDATAEVRKSMSELSAECGYASDGFRHATCQARAHHKALRELSPNLTLRLPLALAFGGGGSGGKVIRNGRTASGPPLLFLMSTSYPGKLSRRC